MPTIADLTADRVIYRDLEPCDPELPGLRELGPGLGLPAGHIPRKRDPEYARLILGMARAAQARRGGPPLSSLAVIGDTENDRLLAAHSRASGELPTYGFIGVEKAGAGPTLSWDGDTADATSWAALPAWAAALEARGVEWASCALLIDIDKTLLGPRGRADAAIDEARAEGALAVAAELLGPALDRDTFRRVYAELCRKEWHPFTLDNQDYVAATALLHVAGAADLVPLRAAIETGTPPSLLAMLEAAAGRVPPALAGLHAELRERAAANDPTPFKAFRRAELVATVARMADGRLPICAELYDLAGKLAARGALCLAASDKPAESALPPAELAAAGMQPLHRTPARLG